MMYPKSLIAAFYNVENLFDTRDEPTKNDDDFLPGSRLEWSDYRYMEKLGNIALSISGIHPGKLPAIIGLAEIENSRVLQDLTSQDVFQRKYDFVHFESPDKRGIDVALLYDRTLFTVQSKERIGVWLDGDVQRSTRDILYVKGTLDGEHSLHFYVNHWPSRREGTNITMPYRITAAQGLYRHARGILQSDAMAKILIMGDFNDLPVSKSIVEHLNSRAHRGIRSDEFYNLAHRPYKKKMGSVFAKNRWLMFDQMLVSLGMMTGEGVKVSASRLTVHYDKKILFYDKGRSMYRPNRTYSGKKYHGGFSDHLPVYVHLDME
jgi:hypothetical protein